MGTAGKSYLEAVAGKSYLEAALGKSYATSASAGKPSAPIEHIRLPSPRQNAKDTQRGEKGGGKKEKPGAQKTEYVAKPDYAAKTDESALNSSGNKRKRQRGKKENKQHGQMWEETGWEETAWEETAWEETAWEE